jgi:hypothetical protein
MDDGAEACLGFVGAPAMRLNSLSSPKKLDQVTPFVPWPPLVEIGDTQTERIRRGD